MRGEAHRHYAWGVDICPLGSNWLFGETEEVSQIGWVELVTGRVNGDSRYHLTLTGQIQLYIHGF